MSLTLHTAEILYAPGTAEPIGRDRALLIDREGFLLEIGTIDDLADRAGRRVDHPLITPGFVNAHVHLTDGYRAERVPGGSGLVTWIGSLLASRGEAGEDRIAAGAADTLREMEEAGTVAVGEVVNDLQTVVALRQSGIASRLIIEILAADPATAEEAFERYRSLASEADDLPVSPAAHAPYSVSPALTARLVEEGRRTGAPFFIHLAEDPDERALYSGEGGGWVDFLGALGLPSEHFTSIGRSPIEEFDRLGLLAPGFVGVHLAEATDREVDLLARRGAAAVLSPGSNLHIGNRLPPYRRIVASGLRFALGTDGRGSAPSIDVLNEARILQENFPEEEPRHLLRALTIEGGRILGLPEVTHLVPGGHVGVLAHSISPASPDENGIAGALLDRDNKIRRIA